jgi:hypothetical protein
MPSFLCNLALLPSLRRRLSQNPQERQRGKDRQPHVLKVLIRRFNLGNPACLNEFLCKLKQTATRLPQRVHWAAN